MSTPRPRFNRRQLLAHLTRTGLALGGLRLQAASSDSAPLRRRIGACDWSIGKLGDPAAFELARELGLDGLQVSLGTAANDMHLRRPEVQEQYRQVLARTGLSVGSLAIGELNNIPFKSDPRPIEWVADSIEVCRAFGARTVLLAFFYKGDLKGDAAGTAETVRRLRSLAPRAEQAGVQLGIESWLSAEEHVDIIQRVGSPAIKVYYDVANSAKMGYDIYREIRWLGRQGLICEFHAKENGALLGQGVVDFPRVRQAMDEIGYSGWVQIEGAVPPGGAIAESYRANRQFLRDLFA